MGPRGRARCRRPGEDSNQHTGCNVEDAVVQPARADRRGSRIRAYDGDNVQGIQIAPSTEQREHLLLTSGREAPGGPNLAAPGAAAAWLFRGWAACPRPVSLHRRGGAAKRNQPQAESVRVETVLPAPGSRRAGAAREPGAPGPDRSRRHLARRANCEGVKVARRSGSSARCGPRR